VPWLTRPQPGAGANQAGALFGPQVAVWENERDWPGAKSIPEDDLRFPRNDALIRKVARNGPGGPAFP